MGFLFLSKVSLLYFVMIHNLITELLVTVKSHPTGKPIPPEFDPIHFKHYVEIIEICTNIILIHKEQNLNLIVFRFFYEAGLPDNLKQLKLGRRERRGPFSRTKYSLIRPYFGQRFLIFGTNMRLTIEQGFPGWRNKLVDFRLFEILIIEIGQVPGRVVNALHLKYFNTYHHSGLVVAGKPSQRWYTIECLSHDGAQCFRSAQIVGKDINELSKYFVEITLYRGRKDVESKVRKWYDRGCEERELHEIVKLTKLSELASFWSFQDASKYSNLNITPRHRTPAPQDNPDMEYTYVTGSVESFSFVSCYKERFPAKSNVFGVRLLLWVWILMSGTVLTNWYKTSFTLEMIVPVMYASPLETWLDIPDMEALLPLNMFQVLDSESFGAYSLFHLRMHEKFTTSTRYRAIAEQLSNIKVDPSDRRKPINEESFVKEEFMTRWERILKTHLLRYSPLKPIQYSETVRLVEKLSTCGKIEFLDTTENIASLLPFLNDNQDKIKYLSGIEPFFKVARGWKIYPVRNATNFTKEENNTRIVRGYPTTIEEYPYQVSIQAHGSHYCGGSLISDRHVLTSS
ncbi:Trypsin V-B [Folsomia candida]|uniref:Trypsin V-B n=1 Tax=Folsomia candida TaxID=158441 RepID=A0A226DE85_FOLCA|nr:Trypsin V-B [Folsomia candida]